MTSATWHIRQRKICAARAKLHRWYTKVSWDIPDIKYIKKFWHGTPDPYNPLTEAEKNAQMEKINRELRYGKIVAIETGLNEIKIDGHTLYSTWNVFLIGYRNRPDGV